MLSDKEIQFLSYWEKSREKQNTVAAKLISGFPMALLFSLPILLFIVMIRLFFPDWYMKISGISAGSFVTAIFAIFGIVLFYSFFRMQFKWEMNEQLFKELKKKQTDDIPGNSSDPGSIETNA